MRVSIRLKKPLSKKFKGSWANSIKDFMVPGWETWIDNDSELDGIKCGDSRSVHPEDNEWMINFPADIFEILEPLNLDEVFKL